MDFPIKQLFNWKTANIAPTLLGIAYLILPFLAGGASMDYTTITFGLMFLGIAIVQAKTKPTFLSGLFSSIVGICYVFTVATQIDTAILWATSLICFGGIVVFEIVQVKIGPANAKAKVLTVVPLTLLGFSILLGIAGYNPYVVLDWSGHLLVALNYIAVMLFCWLYVFNYAGWKPLGNGTVMWINLMAIAAVLLTLIGIYQGTLYSWTALFF
jgi:hypothetical protein